MLKKFFIAVIFEEIILIMALLTEHTTNHLTSELVTLETCETLFA